MFANDINFVVLFRKLNCCVHSFYAWRLMVNIFLSLVCCVNLSNISDQIEFSEAKHHSTPHTRLSFFRRLPVLRCKYNRSNIVYMPQTTSFEQRYILQRLKIEQGLAFQKNLSTLKRKTVYYIYIVYVNVLNAFLLFACKLFLSGA